MKKKQILEGKSLTIKYPKMTRRFISGGEAANIILCALVCGKNKDIFVEINTWKIISLAENQINISGQKLNILIIGIHAGEILEEKPYENDEFTTTSTTYLSLLNKKNLLN